MPVVNDQDTRKFLQALCELRSLQPIRQQGQQLKHCAFRDSCFFQMSGLRTFRASGFLMLARSRWKRTVITAARGVRQSFSTEAVARALRPEKGSVTLV